MKRSLAVVALGCLCAAAWAQAGPVQLVRLQHTGAEEIAAILGFADPLSDEEVGAYREDWLHRFASAVEEDLNRQPEDASPDWRYAMTMDVSPRERGGSVGSAAHLVPAGIERPVVVLASQNALLVRGTPGAMDELRELLALLDVKQRMVSVEVRLVDNPRTDEEEWGIAYQGGGRGIGIVSRGNVPPDGLQIGKRFKNSILGFGANRQSSGGEVVTGASVTTTNNVPAVISSGRMLPVFTTAAYYDRFGNRHIDTQVESIFIGTELFVLPRINGDDTVTMDLRPTFIESVGVIVGPNGVSLPITEELSTGARVTVRDGETVELGGFERSVAEYSNKFSGLLSRANRRITSHPRLFVTPRIVRDIGDAQAP